MCQRIISQTGCGTDILAAVGQVSIVLETSGMVLLTRAINLKLWYRINSVVKTLCRPKSLDIYVRISKSLARNRSVWSGRFVTPPDPRPDWWRPNS